MTGGASSDTFLSNWRCFDDDEDLKQRKWQARPEVRNNLLFVIFTGQYCSEKARWFSVIFVYFFSQEVWAFIADETTSVLLIRFSTPSPDRTLKSPVLLAGKKVGAISQRHSRNLFFILQVVVKSFRDIYRWLWYFRSLEILISFLTQQGNHTALCIGYRRTRKERRPCMMSC